MAHDGSMASLIEAWIVTTLEGLDAFADRDVKVFEGSTSPTGQQLVEELTGGVSSPHVVVLFEGDSPRPLEEGEQAYDPTYGIYVIVQNQRPGIARTGEVVASSTVYGTNGLRDLIRNALHDQYPDMGANGFYADRAEFRGVQVVFQRKDAFVMRAEVVVRETPAAA